MVISASCCSKLISNAINLKVRRAIEDQQTRLAFHFSGPAKSKVVIAVAIQIAKRKHPPIVTRPIEIIHRKGRIRVAVQG